MQNDLPSSSAPTAQTQLYARITSALAGVDAPTWIALGAIFIGWFLLDTLRVEWGPLDRRVPFYDLAAVIASPTRLFTGIEGHRGLGSLLFAIVCIAALFAPLLPAISRTRWAAWGSVAPFAMMIGAALLLYAVTSQDVIPNNADSTDTLANDVRHFANHLLSSASASVSRKVTFAPGGYLALVGAFFAAVRGLRVRGHR
jgi:hypothetical protein